MAARQYGNIVDFQTLPNGDILVVRDETLAANDVLEWAVSFDIGTSITYGHDTAVAEDNIENFTGLWSGTGSIVGSGDNESIELDNSEYMELTDPYEIGVGLCRWTDGKYQSTTGTLIKKYKTGSTSIACEADTWHTYTIPFVCSEFVKLRVEAPA